MSREDLVEVQEQEDLEIEGPGDQVLNENIDVIEDEEGNALMGEPAPETPEENFYANLAEFLDEAELKSLASKLLADFKDDSLARKSYIETYTKGLDLLGFKYMEVTRPFIGASGVTHPLLAEAATQFQAQAFKELLPSDGPIFSSSIFIKSFIRYVFLFSYFPTRLSCFFGFSMVPPFL